MVGTHVLTMFRLLLEMKCTECSRTGYKVSTHWVVSEGVPKQSEPFCHNCWVRKVLTQEVKTAQCMKMGCRQAVSSRAVINYLFCHDHLKPFFCNSVGCVQFGTRYLLKVKHTLVPSTPHCREHRRAINDYKVSCRVNNCTEPVPWREDDTTNVCNAHLYTPLCTTKA